MIRFMAFFAFGWFVSCANYKNNAAIAQCRVIQVIYRRTRLKNM